jgi:fido (protein-threonine AMPylation protein)
MATKRFRRPRNKTELEVREVHGLWKAIALANEVGDGNEPITLEIILRLHRTILAEAYPEIAGRFRRLGEDIKKLKCIEPPPGSAVQEQMYVFWGQFDVRLSLIPRRPQRQTEAKRREWYDEVVDLAAWAQHEIVAIHPFCEANGRLARLVTNVVLKRFGLYPSRVKYEGEDKASYLAALCQIDLHRDYKPLKRLIVESIRDALQREARIRQSKETSDH